MGVFINKSSSHLENAKTGNSLIIQMSHCCCRVLWFTPCLPTVLVFICPWATHSMSTRATSYSWGQPWKKKVARDFVYGINKVSLHFYESCPGLVHWQLVFSITCNGMFAQSLAFLSYKSLMLSKSPQHKYLNQFPLYCCRSSCLKSA